MKKDSSFYKILRPIITILVKIIYHPTYIGTEFLNIDDAFILAGNHTSILDCLLLISATKKNIHFLAKKELWNGPKKILFANLGLIPVDRSIHDHKALASSYEYLNNGLVIGIFPEGTTRKGEKKMRSFKIGAVKMAKVTNKVIIPFVINGKYKLFRKNIKIKFLKPITIKNNDLDKENKKLYNIINNELED